MKPKFIAVTALFVGGCGSGAPIEPYAYDLLPQFGAVASGPVSSAEFEQLIRSDSALLDALDADALELRTPTTASANYLGVLGVDLYQTRSLNGRLSMNANFVTNTVDGEFSDLAYYDDYAATPVFLETLTGSIPITEGSISDATLSASINGTVEQQTGYAAFPTPPLFYGVGINMKLDGLFIDNGGQSVVIGSVSGTVRYPDEKVNPFGPEFEDSGGFFLVETP